MFKIPAEWEFKYQQGVQLKEQSEDPQIKAGVCAAMSYDWIKRNLAGIAVTAKTYADVGFLASQQRAYSQAKDIKAAGWADDHAFTEFWTMCSKGDNLSHTDAGKGENKADFTALGTAIDGLAPGIYKFSIRSAKGGHAMALNTKTKKFFDPNLGQFGSSGKLGKDVSDTLIQVYKKLFVPGKFLIWSFTGTPRDAAWLKANPAP